MQKGFKRFSTLLEFTVLKRSASKTLTIATRHVTYW